MINNGLHIDELLKKQSKLAKRQLIIVIAILVVVLITMVITVATLVYGALFIGCIAVFYLLVVTYAKAKINSAVEKYEILKARIGKVIGGHSSLQEAESLFSDMKKPLNMQLDRASSALINKHYHVVKRALIGLYKKDYFGRLRTKVSQSKTTSDFKLNQQILNHPLSKIKEALQEAIIKIRRRREDMQANWDEQFQQLSWWEKLNSTGGPDFSELDSHANQLKSMQGKFNRQYEPILKRFKSRVSSQQIRARNKIDEDFEAVKCFVNEQKDLTVLKENQPDYMLKIAGWCGAFGLGHSLWSDFLNSHAVYDALRSVNGNYAAMSDTEIWYETLWMSEESLVGLTSLTKGAYLEQLVAQDTGGVLFEHFNNPGTDITIDGIEYQIKATDSVEYIESVDESIPVIATSEVAELTSVIDAGVSNAELTEEVELALGGTGVDVVDGVTDGVLAGLGGIGTFATLRGIYAANKLYETGASGEEAVLTGAGVAVKGTAKAIVDVSEMAFKVAASKPSRFVGRQVYKLGKKVMK